MKHATSLALHAYWHKRRQRDGVRAGVIEAAELAPILPWLFLLEWSGAGGANFSFCGQAIAARYGRDLCHEPFLTLWGEQDRTLLSADLKSMSADGRGLVAGTIAETLGGGFTAFEMLLLPLSGESGMAGVIGSMVRIGGHDEKNRVRARVIGQSLRSTRFLDAPRALPVARFKPAGVPPRGDRPRQYGHLTVLPGGRTPDGVQRPRLLTDN